MRSSVASNSSLTQMPSLAATIPLGPSPTPMVPVTVPDAGSILETVRSSALATHTAPGVTAMPAGPEPTGSGPSGWPVAGSIRWTVPSSPLATQTAFRPGRDAVRAPADLDRPPRHGAGRGVDPVHGVVALVGHPHAAAPGRDGNREIADRDRVDGPADRGTDARHRPVTAVGDPHVRPVTATALGADPTGICCTTAWLAGSIRHSMPSALSTAHTDPSP